MYVDDILLSLTCSFIRSGSRILLIKSNGILFNGVFLTVLILGPMSHLSQLSIYCILIAEREGEVGVLVMMFLKYKMRCYFKRGFVLNIFNIFVHSEKLRQTRQMRPCVDPASGGLPVSHVRHIAVHVHLPRVLPPRRPLHARLQHVPVAGGRRVRLRRQVRHEGGRVSSERTSHHPSALTISKRTKLLQYWQQKPLSHTCPVQ